MRLVNYQLTPTAEAIRRTVRLAYLLGSAMGENDADEEETIFHEAIESYEARLSLRHKADGRWDLTVRFNRPILGRFVLSAEDLTFRASFDITGTAKLINLPAELLKDDDWEISIMIEER